MPITVTYGKRSVKRKNPFEEGPDAAVEEQTNSDDEDEPLPRPTKGTGQKKRRIEYMKPSGSTKQKEDMPPAHKPVEGKGTPELSAINATRTYGTLQKPPPEATTSRPVSPSESFPSVFVPPKATEPAQPTKLSSPTKLAKRMLARSKTETTVDSQTVFTDRRMPSLPILPSSQMTLSQPSLSPSRTNTPLNISIATSSSSLLPLPAPSPHSSSTAVSRTYAGKMRSFLSAPASALSADGTVEDLEDEFSRESYKSLRERWGVDQSEDDPFDIIGEEANHSSQSPSPSKSRTYRSKGSKSTPTTPIASPSKKNKLRVPALPSGMMNPLKSITELRNKGESRRFLDEVAYLLDGMSKAQGAGLIRASALEMATKLCDSEFFRKAKAADVFQKVYDLFFEVGIGCGDKVLDTLFLFYMVLISKDRPSLKELASHVPEILTGTSAISSEKGKGKAPVEVPKSLVGILFSILDTTCTESSDPLVLVASPSDVTAAKYSVAELRRAGLGKKEKITMATILSTIKNKSGVFSGSTKLRTPLLVTHILQSLPPSFIPQDSLPSLLNSLRGSLQGLLMSNDTRSDATESKLSLDQNIDFENVFAHLRLIDLYLLGQWAPLEVAVSQSQSRDADNAVNEAALTGAREGWLVEGLVALGIQGEISLRHDDEGAAKCLESVLRVLVSLTHGDEAWSRSVVLENVNALKFLMRVVAKSGEEVDRGRVMGVKKEDPEDIFGNPEEDSEESALSPTRALDRLCLSLALLTNLVQTLEDVKDLIRETYLDPTCSLQKRSCLDACSCSRRNSASALEILVQLYERQSAVKDEAEEEVLQMDADAAFLRGHLAVLFGLIMQGNAANQRALLNGSAQNGRVKVSRLVDQARQFVAFFAVVVGGEEGRRVDEREKEVARSVVHFLEELCSKT